MNDPTRRALRTRASWPPATRVLVAIIVGAALAVPGVALASSPASAGAHGSVNASVAAYPHSTSVQKAVAYAHCMRHHGVPRYPDPSSSNETSSGLPKVSFQQLGVSSATFQRAANACKRLLPKGSQPSQAES